ncbi:hypothetical protein IFM89_024547 [Coptis chinensis]|uniref:Uncharacterized protein n=1 Tax=Coptis chinensis TaxID=261450 RepID=A0A835HNB8_9MAGN|nr:hypothetical protein IFM89_024547 [Coptis chinensis]
MVARSSSIISDQGAEVQGLSTGVGDSATGGTDVQGLSTAVGDNVTGAGNDQQLLSGSGTFSVKDYGVKGDGKPTIQKGFQSAWQAACAASGSPTLSIPKGMYLIGPVKFTETDLISVSSNHQGTLLGSSNLGQYAGNDWLQFGWLSGLTITGGGTPDGQGAQAWPQNKCPKSKQCNTLPANLKFNAVTNSFVKGIKSVNSKFFHIGMVDTHNVQFIGLTITAPDASPNTDGIHIERSSGISVVDSHIGTGDDCISIGHGSTQITVTGVTCGPGHGISVGSLGRYPKEEDVRGIIVKGCTLTGTMNGIRIKTWENSPGPSTASNMTFDDIIMVNVGNPIIIDQTYCPFSKCDAASPSKVKLQDITFRNIRGTSKNPEAVTLDCSSAVPCQNVILEEINLQHSAGPKCICKNVKAKFVGKQLPAPCAV